MKCACNRWGPGTTCERPTNTQASKELQERLEKMRQERSTQDTMWSDTQIEREPKKETPSRDGNK
jgi:hypothetical protein